MLPAPSFSYDARQPLSIRVNTVVRDGDVMRTQISFMTPAFGRVRAEVIGPRYHPSGAAVLFVHWLGAPATTNHTEFEPDALALAKHGITSLLIDAMWSQPHWFMRIREPGTDYNNSIAQVIELRRSIDVLEGEPGVDPNRIAYVGHDFGAMYGEVLSGVDRRPRWWVFMAGTEHFSDWYLLGAKPPDRNGYIARMAALDPAPYLRSAKGSGFLFQFATNDQYVTSNQSFNVFRSAPTPRYMAVYSTDHSLQIRSAKEDRLAWLLRRMCGSSGSDCRSSE